ncbi:MAG: 3'-5' exonuclease [Dehalococcoidia bacterium]|nr:3'-5' exonuclease [Dehalococcoidia bacterium]
MNPTENMNSTRYHTLNQAQKEAVFHRDGPALIIAGPGSGKTRVITERIANLIREDNIRPWNILAITFTNKAAKEMQNRVNEILGDESRGLAIGTFHAMCARILRQFGEPIGIASDFVIYDTDDTESLVKSIMKELNTPDRFKPRQIRNRISTLKTMERTQDSAYRLGSDSYLDDLSINIKNIYDARLRRANAVDFDDLLNLTHTLLTEFEHSASFILDRFEHVLVDEFQDTNLVQYEIARALAQKSRNLVVVGDDDQSIYSWRAADIENFHRLIADFPEAKTINLDQNYRSTGHILEAAQIIINKNSGRTEKNLWTDNSQGAPVQLLTSSTADEEAWFVANEIRKHQNSPNVKENGFGVLYRTNAQSRAIEDALISNGIPYRLVGGTRFYDRKEIKDIVAYLRLIQNEHDIVAFQRVVNTPARGIGNKTLSMILQTATDTGTSPVAIAVKLVSEDAIPGIPSVTSRAKKAIQLFTSVYEHLASMRDTNNVPQLIDAVVTKTGFRAYLNTLDKDQPDRSESRWENIEEFKNVAAQYNELEEETSLHLFLEQVALVSDVDQPENNEESVNVTLTTLHSAKGLEFPVVFLVGMEEGLLPHQRSFDDEQMMEEERRLCYVGITRAREQLYLTQSLTRYLYGRSTSGSTSRYLKDLQNAGIETSETPSAQSVTSTRSYNSSYTRKKYNLGNGLRESQIKTENSHHNDIEPFKAGDKVRHGRFGIGTVINIKQDGSDWEIQVAFESQGVRKLYQSFAQLSLQN